MLDDPLLWTAVKNTLWFTFLALVLRLPDPADPRRADERGGRAAKGLYSALAYLPVVIPPVAAILLWRVFYDASPNGVFNTVLGWVGLGPYPWIQDPTWSMPSVVLLATWSAAGATVIIYLAALRSVRTELYEAAEVDGAGIFRKVWHVTLPQLRNVMFVTLILQLIGTFQVFTEPFLLTNGGPADSTVTILLLIYRYAFGAGGGGDYGAATALSLMLAAFLAVFSAVYFRVTRPWATHDDDGDRRRRRTGRCDVGVPTCERRRRAASADPLVGRTASTSRCCCSCVVVGLGPTAVAGQGVGELDAGHAAPADGPVPERRRSGEPLDGLERRPDRSLLLEHRQGRRRLVAGAARRRRHRRLRPRRSSSRGTPSSSPGWWWPRCSSRRSCCWCRCSSPCSTCRSSACSLLNNYWALWLPAGASAFNVLLVEAVLREPPDAS